MHISTTKDTNIFHKPTNFNPFEKTPTKDRATRENLRRAIFATTDQLFRLDSPSSTILPQIVLKELNISVGKRTTSARRRIGYPDCVPSETGFRPERNGARCTRHLVPLPSPPASLSTSVVVDVVLPPFCSIMAFRNISVGKFAISGLRLSLLDMKRLYAMLFPLNIFYLSDFVLIVVIVKWLFNVRWKKKLVFLIFIKNFLQKIFRNLFKSLNRYL